jgi:hypothetical protein
MEGIDVAMRYETINEDLRDVFGKAGMPADVTIPSVNRTEERPAREYSSFYSRWSRLAVSIAFSDDLRKYGYVFEPSLGQRQRGRSALRRGGRN